MIGQYDHQVRASSVINALQGKQGIRGHGDAVVLKPLTTSYRGLAIAIGVNPWFTSLDPYNGGRSAVDEVCRNIAAVGGSPHALTDCLNFGNPEKPERLWEFKEAVRGIGDMARALELAVPSGNVSFYNESSKGGAMPTPTILGVGIVEDIRKCVTTDLKTEGNPVYVVGRTDEEMGGSILYRRYGGLGGKVPEVDPSMLASNMKIVKEGIDKGIIRSCHDCSDGGLVIALAEMCIGGDLGFEGDLSYIPGADPVVKMFSESNSRFIVEVDASKEREWSSSAEGNVIRIGRVGGMPWRKVRDQGW